ncbi:MAG: hypothetical protein JWO47_14 [Candidatus Saccharibacteria bacterium]|nr:hypothetical protein [Candidatus Saccharibacteria bacterium]
MISVECGEHDSTGFADLEEAISLAKAQGISNAKNAISPDLLWDLHSFAQMVAMGATDILPGVRPSVAGLAHLAVHSIDPSQVSGGVSKVLKGAEAKIQLGAGESLPRWRPTSSLTGVRMVAMTDGAKFYPHTDDYEGLVASLQIAVDDKKIMNAKVNGSWETEQIVKGDITFFGCDTFSAQPRVEHGFTFSGLLAVAFTLGQDPFYTISGNYPSQREHPEFFVDIQ